MTDTTYERIQTFCYAGVIASAIVADKWSHFAIWSAVGLTILSVGVHFRWVFNQRRHGDSKKGGGR